MSFRTGSYADVLGPDGENIRPRPRPTLLATSRGKIIGQHASVREVIRTIDRVAHSNCTVLITGESGTGKELAVAALHDASPRREHPLVAVNCGAIPENLIESELFGHARGAFTGAHAARLGRVASAEGGTLFLDEVGELPLAVQVKILRLLQQREYSPVGESKVLKCNIRIVAATNRDLEKEVETGRFREDLYYRLNVIHVHLPALRDRGNDVETLAMHFLRACAARAERYDLEGFTDEAMAAIRSFEWPGNVRALENAVERAVLLTAGPVIDLEDLPERVRRPHDGPRSTGERAPTYERAVVERAVAEVEAPASAAVPVAPRARSMIGGSPLPPPLAALPTFASHPSTVVASSSAPESRVLPDAGIDLRAAVDEFERSLIRQALERTGRNKNRAAQLLGLNRTTLVEMVKRKGL